MSCGRISRSLTFLPVLNALIDNRESERALSAACRLRIRRSRLRMGRYLWSQKLTGVHAAHSATTLLSKMPGMSMRRVCGVELRAFVRRAVPCRGMASGRHPRSRRPLQLVSRFNQQPRRRETLADGVVVRPRPRPHIPA